MQKVNCNFTRFSLCLSISLTKSYNNIILLTIYKKPEVTIIFMTSDSLYLFYTVLTPKSAPLSGLSFPCFSWIILLLISKRSWIVVFGSLVLGSRSAYQALSCSTVRFTGKEQPVISQIHNIIKNLIFLTPFLKQTIFKFLKILTLLKFQVFSRVIESLAPQSDSVVFLSSSFRIQLPS